MSLWYLLSVESIAATGVHEDGTTTSVPDRNLSVNLLWNLQYTPEISLKNHQSELPLDLRDLRCRDVSRERVISGEVHELAFGGVFEAAAAGRAHVGLGDSGRTSRFMADLPTGISAKTRSHIPSLGPIFAYPPWRIRKFLDRTNDSAFFLRPR